jgi:tRNA A-37 threonylcarbamoyl transferase component Bud32
LDRVVEQITTSEEDGVIDRSNWVRVASAGLHWHVAPELCDRLFGANGLRLEEWLRGGHARVVKNGPHQTVYHVVLPGLDFYLKHYRLMNVRAWFRQLLRPAKARGEYERARAVAARRVPTITTLGIGERRLAPGPSYLLTESLQGTEPLSTFVETSLHRLEPGRRAAVGQGLARELGKLFARMHDAGIVHSDLHPGNLLVRLDGGDRVRLYLIDLHDVRLGRPLKWPAAQQNLIIFNRWFVLRSTRSERLRFFRAYCAERAALAAAAGRPAGPWGDHPAMTMAVGRDLERRTWKSNIRFWRQREQRCLVTNRYYQRIRSRGIAGYAVRELDPSSLSSLLAGPDEPFAWPGTVILKHSRSSTVAEIDIRVGGVVRRVIYKRLAATAWSDPWTGLVRWSGALKSWIYGHALRDRLLPTARPLAVFHRRRHGLPRDGYLLSEKVPDAVDLRRHLEGLNRLPEVERRAALRCRIDEVARLVRELHRRRLLHRDLKAANILVQSPKSRVQSPKSKVHGKISRPGVNDFGPWTSDFGLLWLIDLAAISRHDKLRRARRLQNLGRLHASFRENAALTRADKLRFLRTYLQWGLLGRGGWKRWWRDIERATQDKVNRNLRNGRPLT